MPLVNPLFGHSGKPTFADARRDLEGAVVRSAAGVMRAGVFPDHLNPLVTSQPSMRVAIADFRAVQNRGGAVFIANVGTDTSVTIAAAPAANRRIDLVYVTMRSSTLGDTADTPIFGVVQGVASATPVVPALPAALSTAIPLATVEVPAGATTTQSAGVIITQVYPYTAMAGGMVIARSLAELSSWIPAPGTRARSLADGECVFANGAWGKSPVARSVGMEMKGQTLAGTAWTDLAVVTGVSAGGEVSAEAFNWAFNGASGADRAIALRIVCDDVVVTPVLAGTQPIPLSGSPRVHGVMAGKSKPAAGTHTWKLQISSSAANAVYSEASTLKITEIG